MRNLKLIAPVTAALLLLAGAALATDFHPILDADFIGYPDDVTSFVSRYDASQPGPLSDAEWGEPLDPAESMVALVPASFDPILDADFLGGSGYEPAGLETPAYARCAADCTMACGSACADHCGTACASR